MTLLTQIDGPVSTKQIASIWTLPLIRRPFLARICSFLALEQLLSLKETLEFK